jgi:hypothetical protein
LRDGDRRSLTKDGGRSESIYCLDSRYQPAAVWQAGYRLWQGWRAETVAGSFTPVCHRENKRGPAITGVFFSKQTADSLAEAILAFESHEKIFVPEHIQLHARQFDSSVFIDRMRNYIKAVIAEPHRHHLI